MNITLTIEDETIQKARRVAAKRNTTVTSLVREFLQSVATAEDQDHQQAVGRLERSINKLSRPLNYAKRTWTREDIYGR